MHPYKTRWNNKTRTLLLTWTHQLELKIMFYGIQLRNAVMFIKFMPLWFKCRLVPSRPTRFVGYCVYIRRVIAGLFMVEILVGLVTRFYGQRTITQHYSNGWLRATHFKWFKNFSDVSRPMTNFILLHIFLRLQCRPNDYFSSIWGWESGNIHFYGSLLLPHTLSRGFF